MSTFRYKIYDFFVKNGLIIIQKLFPDYFAGEPLKPTDRFVEVPFVVRNLTSPPAKVLDVGCAGSFFPLLLAGCGYDTYGIDIREYSIINKINYQNFKFVRENITKTSFPDNYFDAITAISAIEHIGVPGRYQSDKDFGNDIQAIQEIKRILKKDGCLLITVPFGKGGVIGSHFKAYDTSSLKELISGLKVVKEEYYTLDKENDWYNCKREIAEQVVCKPYYYSLALLKLMK